MVFRAQVEPLLERGLREVASCSTRLALDDLVTRACEVHPNAAVARIEVGNGDHGATMVRFADKQDVYVNPCSGVVLGQRPQWAGFFGTGEQLHRFRFIDDADLTELFGGTVSLVLAPAIL